MQQAKTQAGPNLKYLNRPEIPETFADSLENLLIDGSVVRLEFVVNRLDPIKPPATMATGSKQTCCRIVLPMPALFQVANQLSRVIAGLQAQGIIKEVQNPPTGGKPN